MLKKESKMINKKDRAMLAKGNHSINIGSTGRKVGRERSTLRHFKETTNDYILQATKKVSNSCNTGLKKLYKLW